MRMHLKEADIYNLLTSYFEAFPFNDMALQRVFTIYAYALDSNYVPTDKTKETRIQHMQAAARNNSEHPEEQKQLEDQILVHVLFQTQLVDKITKLVSENAQVKFSKSFKTEMGYMAFIVELGQMLNDLKTKNEAVRECLEDTDEWDIFVSTSLKKQIEHRKGPLYDDPRCPKADSDEANFMSRLVGNFKPRKRSTVEDPDADEADVNLKLAHHEQNVRGELEAAEEDTQTKQEDMDRLIQPFLSFEDEGDEDAGGFEVNDISPEYDANKYSSNTVRNKPLNFAAEEEEGGQTVMQRMEAKEKARAKKNRYGGFGMVQIPKAKKKQEVLGVTGVDFDSDENEDARYSAGKAGDEDEDEDIERDEALTLDELDGWMSKINQRMSDDKYGDDQDIGPEATQEPHDEEEDFDFINAHFKMAPNRKPEPDLAKQESFGLVLQQN